jgi:uncharacterized membrane protein YbhN (UPF0104 family)
VSTLSPAAAHALCVACVLADAAARALRLQLLVRPLGGALGFGAALAANAVEDAAAGLTPMRVGGTPARALVLTRRQVPVRIGVLATLAESALAAPVVLLVALLVGGAWAPGWWRTVGPRLGRSAVHVGPWLALGGALGIVAWLLVRRLLPGQHHAARRTLMHAAHELRRFPRGSLVGSVLLTLVSVVARIGVLPLLALALPGGAAIGPVILGSFALLYAQLLLPTPSGAGAVELGVLAGAAGVSGPATTGLLVAWRGYTTVAPIVAGAIAAAALGLSPALGAGPARAWRALLGVRGGALAARDHQPPPQPVEEPR